MLKLTMPNHETKEVEIGIRVQDVIREYDDAKHIYAITLNGKLHDLNYRIKHSGEVSFIYDTSTTGKIIYERTLNFLFITAVKLRYKEVEIRMEHALSEGQYCVVEKEPFLSPKDVQRIEETMQELIARKENIQRKVVPTQTAVALFESQGMDNKADLLRDRKSTTSSIYSLCGINDYFYGFMLPDTSYITHFSIRYYAPGIWLSAGHHLKSQAKLFHVFQEFEAWGRMIGVSNVAQLNKQIMQGNMDNLVLMSETMIEKKLAELADLIVHEHPLTKFVLIAGPSSAGKTTFSRRLAIHLKILGKIPLAISMDNFYRNREDCPKLADGTYDFEVLEALDLELFNETMLKLLHHTPVHLPLFNFKTGLREWNAHETLLAKNQILIIEGIHGLNPQTSAYLPDDAKFKIYMNALTHLNLDEHNRIATSEYRLIRRIARDYQFRGWSALSTIHFWKNVRHGEEHYIYPFQEEADVIFNSSMVYELPVLKKIVLPLLNQVKKEDAEYLEADRLKKLLAYFVDGESMAIPRSSILAEFIGNSIFDV